MSKEHILRWMLEFGTDWVSQTVLHGTWADREITWSVMHSRGYLKIQDMRRASWNVRLTSKAIKSLKERDDGVSQ